MVSAQTGQIELTKQDPPQALQEESRGAAPSSRPRPKDPGAQELAGTVVLIDGYQPSKRFEAWLLQEYLPELRRAVLPVVLVVAGYSGDVGALAQSAGRTVSLGPLPAGPVIDYFRVLNQSLAVKMEDEEIQAYSRASAEDPRLIDALSRLLQLK